MVSQGAGQGASQGAGQSASQGVGEVASQGVSQGVSQSASRGASQGVSQGVSQSASQRASREFQGRRVLVTGSTAGIGEAIAGAFAAAGAEVVVHGRNRAAGEAVAARIGGRFIAADLADPRGVEALASQTAALGPLDVLVNNAGVEIAGPFADLPAAAIDTLLQVNLVAPLRLTQLLLPALRQSGAPSVINISSIHETVPCEGNLVYCVAKAGLGMMTKTGAVELAREGIRINCIAPGAIETAMNRELLDQIGRDLFAEWIPQGRVGSPDDVAGVALFLASDAARYVNGHTLVVDGAYSHHLVRYPKDPEADRPGVAADGQD
ncbi:MAG: glucose 1-dehydrogenase [Propionibacteriaceae bacterium]|jgi:glucose 1-dehydrogenase|nr:glucose 1-dehydrogenase [Propionibacteriaceae bacterium]